MTGESTGRKIWRVIYPVIALFVFYFAVVYGSMLVLSSASCAGSGTLDDSMNRYFGIVTAVALVIIIIVESIFFKNDFVFQPRTYIRKPVFIVTLLVLGAALSHGLNLLISLCNVNGIFGSYEAVQAEIFAPGVVFVILRALILAPVAEELCFRGLVFRRMKEYTSFWPAAILSSALFGLYHMNLGQGIYAFLFGILLAFMYDRFQHLLAPVLMHFAANALSVILEYTKAQYSSEIVFFISMVLMFAISAACTLFLIRKIPKKG